MISLRPFQAYIRNVLGRPMPDVIHAAHDRWEVAPGYTRYIPPAISIPGQIERIQQTKFSSQDAVIKAFQGDFESAEGPTMGYRLKHVDLADGVLYAKGSQRHLRQRAARSLTYKVPQEVTSGAMYESWRGNRWFGNWLIDDCLAYGLAAQTGPTVTSAPKQNFHVPQYEALLGIDPQRIQYVRFEELIVFDDIPNNAGKTARAAAMRTRLLAGKPPAEVPGVFLLRGQTGDARIMANEYEIAERLSTNYGFQVLDITKASVDEIAMACGHAAIVAGVEGSQLAHGLVMMPPDATLFAIQPPDRTVAFLKTVTDRQNQRFAFAVGEGDVTNFTVDWDIVQRTIDLIA